MIAQGRESRPAESEQLRQVDYPLPIRQDCRERSEEDDETIETEPQPCIQGEGRVGFR